MDIGLKDRVALITGASRGIGAASAKALAASGAIVIINYFQSKDKADKLLEEIRQNNGRGMAIKADVRDRGEVDRMVDSVVKEYGKVDILVNNANIDFPMKPFIELSWNEIETKIIDEMKSLYNCSQAVLKDMLPKKSGKLIFISSTLSRSPDYGFAAHAAAKAAMDSIVRVMATELGPLGITANTIGPGLTETDATAGLPQDIKEQVAAITPLKRVGQADDMAKVVVFLASSLSDYLTGEYIPVCGGLYMQ